MHVVLCKQLRKQVVAAHNPILGNCWIEYHPLCLYIDINAWYALTIGAIKHSDSISIFSSHHFQQVVELIIANGLDVYSDRGSIWRRERKPKRERLKEAENGWDKG